jgi:hypothetical protein
MKSFISFLALIAVLVFCVGGSAAQLVRSSPSNSDRVRDFQVSENKDTVSWKAFGREWTVRLVLSDVVEDNTDYFQGTLDGDVNAAVSFALLPGTGLSGMVIAEGNTWWISAQPLPEHGYSEDEDRLGIFMIREEHTGIDANSLPVFSEPLEDENVVPVESTDDAAEANDRKRTISTYRVAVYYDQKWASTSNPWRSQTDTISILNDVNTVYRAAGLNTFTFVYQKQVSNPKTTLNDMLSYFSNTVSTTLSTFTDKTYTNYLWLVGTNVGGLAYVGTTCQGTSAAQKSKTAVTGLVSYSRLWTVKTIAHELGHNRGASHQFTNACTSTLTTGCQCSVMSYCFPSASNNPDGAVNKFSSFTINEMKGKGCY